MDRARHREDLPVLVERQVRGDHRPPVGVRFDDDGAEGEPADDPVAPGEIRRVGTGAEGAFGHHETGGGDPVGEAAVFRGIATVDPRSDHPDRFPSGRERGGVGPGVHAAREAAHDMHSGQGEFPGEMFSHHQAVGGGAPRSNHSDRRLRGDGDPAPDKEDGWSIVDGGETRRVAGIPEVEHRSARGGEVRELTGGFALGVGEGITAEKSVDAGGDAIVEPGDRSQGGERRPTDLERIAKERNQVPKAPDADPGNPAQDDELAIPLRALRRARS